jgi:DNA-binding Lrp family transcriptional regulator
MQEIDQRDRELLNALQNEIPLVTTPFAVLGQLIDMSEKEVIKRTERFRSEGLIRQISALLDGRLLGYRTALVAAKVSEERLEQAAAVISAHPGVSQNYRRNHDFNLWFTLSVGPSSRLSLERTAALLGEEGGCDEVRLLPTLRLLKGTPEETAAESELSAETKVAPLSASDVLMIRILQQDLPGAPRPFDLMARAGGADPEELLSAARQFKTRGQLRKVCAFVQPKRVSFSVSAVGVWEVPERQIERFSAAVNAQKGVTHCYLRPTYEDWPYNVSTTVHGRSVDECEATLDTVARESGISEHRTLFPTREFKRTRITFFAPELDGWESSHLKDSAAAAS